MLSTVKTYSNGLFAAANCVTTGYDKIWIRDNIYTVLGFLEKGDIETSVRVVQGWLDVMLKHEYKIDWMIKEPGKERFRYIHPRYNTDGTEVGDDWGNKQNDAVGSLLWLIGKLTEKTVVLRNEDDKRILQKLVDYLDAIEYWHDEDNGMWEENEEVHASSIGACLAGLQAVQGLVFVPRHMIANGERSLRRLLPRESVTKNEDLALLSLIYPYGVVGKEMAFKILENVEKLVKEKGVNRYVGDYYYNKEGEAEWTIGLPWLAICYKILGCNDKSKHYVEKTEKAKNSKGELPELYFANSNEHNENTPLAWAESLKVVAESK
jgi:phosphorylase kinase alpha/beta subunit